VFRAAVRIDARSVAEELSRIVVGYDGGPDADLAIAWAIETARREHRPLGVVIATSAMDPVLIPDFHERAERLAAEWRDRARTVLAGAGVGDTPIEVVHGPPVPTLLKAVTPADLLVVGSAGHAPFIETVGGSVSQHLARHARCAVVVVRPAQLLDARLVVVGLDGSAESVAAARFACRHARFSHEAVLAVHGFHASPFGDREHTVEQRLDEWLAPVRADFRDVEITPRAVPEPAPRLLRDLSEQASLLVLGSRGRDAFADLLLGSTSQDALHHARCPVAIVH
jgi:nucleotide-binding universal stress UspA family protein